MSFYKMFNILNIEIYTFIGGIGVKGSFEGLYTFLEVAEIYGIDDSCLRKQVARDKFVIGEDVKKMGRTWIITEQAMIKSFGALKFEEYKKKQQKKEQAKEKKLNGVHLNTGSNAQKISKGSGPKRKRSSKKVHSMKGLYFLPLSSYSLSLPILRLKAEATVSGYRLILSNAVSPT